VHIKPARSAFWDGLTEIADAQGTTISRLITAVDSERRDRQSLNLSSAIRLFVLDFYRQQNGRGAVRKWDPKIHAGNPSSPKEASPSADI
jgi:predicted DNA-binding ribbon-helix-helix protein